MIETRYLTQNATFTNPTKIAAEFVIVHSTGAGTDKKERLFSAWNKPGVKLSCHGMVDDLGGIITLPFDVRGWHIGSKGNGKAIGFEICEPSCIAYADKAHTKIDTARYNPDDEAVAADFWRRYRHAVDMAALMCNRLGLHPDRVLCHNEAYTRGMATCHADVLHWFPLFGKGMDDFRRDVAGALSGVKQPSIVAVSPKESAPGAPFVVRVVAKTLNVRVAPGLRYKVCRKVHAGEAYTIVQTQNGWGRLKSGAGWILLDYTERVEQ